MMCQKCGMNVLNLAAHYRMHHKGHMMQPAVVSAVEKASMKEGKELRGLTKKWSGRKPEAMRRHHIYGQGKAPVTPIPKLVMKAGVSGKPRKGKM